MVVDAVVAVVHLGVRGCGCACGCMCGYGLYPCRRPCPCVHVCVSVSMCPCPCARVRVSVSVCPCPCVRARVRGRVRGRVRACLSPVRVRVQQCARPRCPCASVSVREGPSRTQCLMTCCRTSDPRSLSHTSTPVFCQVERSFGGSHSLVADSCPFLVPWAERSSPTTASGTSEAPQRTPPPPSGLSVQVRWLGVTSPYMASVTPPWHLTQTSISGSLHTRSRPTALSTVSHTPHSTLPRAGLLYKLYGSK
jgi:hypothetical protein